jgi:hypothetical protein
VPEDEEDVSREERMEMLLLEMFDSLSTELSRLLEARHRSGRFAGTDADSDAVLLDARIAHLYNTLDRLQVVIGPESAHRH